MAASVQVGKIKMGRMAGSPGRWSQYSPARRRLVPQPLDEFGHLRVVMTDDVRALATHHALRVRLALIDCGADSLLRGRLERNAALLEDACHELPDLRAKLLVRHGLPEDLEALLVRALETSEQLVSNARGSEVGIGDVRGSVRFAHCAVPVRAC